MSARNKRNSLLFFALLMAGAAGILTCSDKIVNSGDTDVVEFQMPLKFAEGRESLAEIVTTFRVTIIADEVTIVANLEYSNGNITGIIENVPAGPDRTIIVEGLAADGTVIYRGSVVITVVADQTVDAEITLFAVAKLVRVSPNFVNGAYGSSVVGNIRADNIAGLTAISLALDYNSAVMELDSVKAGAELPAGTVFSYYDDGGIGIELSHSAPVVNSSGNALLATAFFSPVQSNKCLDSSNLDLGVVSLTAPGVTLSDVYIDDGKAHVSRGRLVVSQDTLKFGLGVSGLNLDFKKVDIADSCGNNIAFTLSTEDDWIDLNTALAGITPGSVYIDVDPTGLPTGTYNGTISVRSPRSVNSPFQISVILEIDRGGRLLELTPDSLNFVVSENGPLPRVRQVRVEEIFGFNILFNVDEEIPWLNIDQTGGITPDSVVVSINTTALAPGTYTDSISFSSAVAGNSPQYVIIRYVLNAVPKFLDVIPDTLYFSAVENDDPPSSQTFRVFETSGYRISFNANENASWLNLSDVSGVTPDTIAANITSTELEPDTYYTAITISSEEADNSPRQVTIKYNLNRGPRTLATDTTLHHFTVVQGGELPPSRTFRVFESGGHSIPICLIEDIPWLSISPECGVTEDTFTISITTTDLDPSLYRDSIKIISDEADNSPIYVRVSLGVTVGPRTIEVEPDSVHIEYVQYRSSFQFRFFRVFESSGYHIPFTASENIPWLSLLGVKGVTEDTIDVTYFGATELEPGLYVDSIMISSSEAENSPIFLKVSLKIIYAPPPNMDVLPDTLHFTAEQNGPFPPSHDFIVQFENDVYLFPIDVSESIPWLTVSKFDSFTVNWFRVEITSTSLESGVYFDSIMISKDEAANSPIFEFVKYTITSVIDSIPPSPVTDLIVEDYRPTSVFLNWTASGDDGNIGTATETDIRYTTDLSTLYSWVGATQVTDESAPLSPGSHEIFEVTGLTPGFTYYFALEIIDDAGNHSEISNVDSVYIPPLPPPAPILISPDSGATNAPLNVNLIWHSAANTDFYQIQYDDDESFSTPTISPDVVDTIFLIGPLSYETTYYWRVRAVNFGGSSDWSSTWSFTTVPNPPTISGMVKDGDGEPLADVLIAAYDDFPNGNALDSEFSNVNGAFSFFDINGNVELYVFKDGYYPQTVSVVTPNNNVLISLLATSAFTPTDQWVDLYCDSSYYFGNLIQPNDVVEAFDPDGVLCGRFIVHSEGAYGFLSVYRDDETSPNIDEGCVTGDIITLKVNDEIAVPLQPLIYPASHELIEACFNVTGEIPKWIVVLKPQGGETFYQDSMVTIEWRSTGISGPVEISLAGFLMPPSVVDTTSNDGHHEIKIPTVIRNPGEWTVLVRDLDEEVSGTSAEFNVSVVSLLLQPASLNFYAVEQGCLPAPKQFMVSEANGLNIPFEVADSIGWLSVDPTGGTTPGTITVDILPNSLPLGFYNGALQVTSANAVYSAIMSINLQIVRYLDGDIDNNCSLQVNDISSMIDFLYRGGNPPVSIDALNVDLCDDVDIADLDFLYNLVMYDSPRLGEGAAICTDDSNDLGARDSLGLVVKLAPSTSQIIPRLQLDLYLYNDGNVVNGLASGFGWDNPHMLLDSVRFAPYVEDSLSFHYAMEKEVLDTTNANQRFLLAANKTIYTGIRPSLSPQLLCSYYFTLSSWTNADSIMVDTLTFNLGTTYKAVTGNGSYRPVWHGPVIIKEPGF